MFDWLDNAFNTVLGVITGSWQSAVNALANYVNNLEHTHYGYWHTVAGNVINSWQEMARACLLAMQGLQAFMLEQSFWDFNISKNVIPNLSNWIATVGGNARNDLNSAINMLRGEIKSGDSAEHGYAASVLAWCIEHILTALTLLIARGWSWITGIGSTMWHYFQDLTDFAELLFMFLVASLERHAWDVAKLLGTFFLALVAANLTRFAQLLEDIIDAVI
jgi:hypothetical protein